MNDYFGNANCELHYRWIKRFCLRNGITLPLDNHFWDTFIIFFFHYIGIRKRKQCTKWFNRKITHVVNNISRELLWSIFLSGPRSTARRTRIYRYENQVETRGDCERGLIRHFVSVKVTITITDVINGGAAFISAGADRTAHSRVWRLKREIFNERFAPFTPDETRATWFMAFRVAGFSIYRALSLDLRVLLTMKYLPVMTPRDFSPRDVAI